MSKNISLTVLDVCRESGIDYRSVNKKVTRFYNDAKKLGKIYLKLKEIASDLQEIEEKHKVNGLGEILLDDIKKLETINHDIIKLATKILKSKKEKC